ncbi:Protein transport protein sec73 [Choanephora cucurbitarum]|uniref:Protein transport protein sec73 n=1 Tax=Choanephora cucurbitarum TaxID=101091 RepID=A0A1C7NE92_9FUNG|nr:Protein transport protein sec73 [Choanephora cucurbitarum]
MVTTTDEQTEANFASQVQQFDFCGESIDASLRKLLAKVHLPKEAQQIDRAMEDFAKQYYECNPGLVDSPDAVYAVAFSILLLHTDAHNKNVRQKMNKDTFIMRTKIIEGGEGFPHEILDIIYDNIVMSEFTYADHPQSTRNHSWFSKLKSTASTTDLHSQTNTNPWMIDLAQKLEQLMPAENSYSYKRTLKPIPIMEIHLSLLKAKSLCLAGVKSRQDTSDQSSNSTFQVRVTKAGILDRKYDLLQGGKKATARGWRPLGVILSGSQIIFFADLVAYQQWLETGSPTNSSFHSLSSNIPTPAYLRPVQIISLSYAVCICDEQYTKYPHVFRLIVGDGQQFLMRAEDDQDMEDWMLKINYAATIKTTGVRLQSKSKESRREERARAKVDELSDRIDEQVRLLDRELQLRRNLMVFVPQQKSTKDRILSFSDAVGKRIKMKRIELQRLECYRDFLEAELSWYQSTYPTRKMSLPLPTHLCSFVQPQGKENKKLSNLVFTAPDIQEEEGSDEEQHINSQPPVLPTFSFPRPLVETVPFTTATDRVTRRRSQSNPVRPVLDKKVLLEPPPEHKARCRSGSVASSVQEDDSMSVVIINESEELLEPVTDVWHDAASQ